IKASLIVLIFMHARESDKLTWLVILTALLFLAILLGGVYFDYGVRPTDRKIRKERPMAARSISNVLRIERAGLVHVAGALDDRAAVREDGEFITVGGELEQKPVVADLAKRQEVMGQLLEVQAAGGAVRDLHGVAAAEIGR